MAATPEGAVKRKVSKYLNSRNDIYYFMPVQYGYGASTLDYLVAVSFGEHAIFFAIETKKPGGKPTERQQLLMAQMGAVGVKTFVIDGDEGIEELDRWLTTLKLNQTPGSRD
jgi:hypothetical protein